MTELSKQGEVMREIPSLTHEISPTAANAQNPLFGASGSQRYRCVMRDGGYVDVDASTGDAAAIAALSERPGGFVMSVNPAPKGR